MSLVNVGQLNQTIVSRLKSKESAYLKRDGRYPRFFVKIYPSGKKSYGLDTINGRKTIGDTKSIEFDDAIVIYKKLLSATQSGGGSRVLLIEVWERYLEHCFTTKGNRPATLESKKQQFKNHIFPALGGKYVDDIKVRDVQSVLDALTSSNKSSVAVKCKRLFSDLFKYCLQQGLLKTSPSEGSQVYYKERKKEKRILTERELANLHRVLAGHTNVAAGRDTIDAAFILLFTGLRMNEVQKMRWEDVNWLKKVYVVSVENSKTSKKYYVPLSEQVLRRLKLRSIRRTGRIFNLGDNAVSQFLSSYSTGVRSSHLFDGSFRSHALRRTMLTVMVDKFRIDREYAKLMLNHADYDGAISSYDMSNYIEQKREWYIKWEAYLDGLEISDSGI